MGVSLFRFKTLVLGISVLFLSGCSGGFESLKYKAQSFASGFLGINDIVAPEAGAHVSDTVAVTGSCETDSVVLRSSQMNADVSVPCSSGIFQADVDLSGMDGLVDLTAVFEKDGELESRTVRLIKDTLAPQFEIYSPRQGRAIQSDLTLTGVCESGLPVLIQWNGQDYETECTDNIWRTKLTVTGPDGDQTVTARQQDAALNRTEVSVSVVKDTQAPVIQVTSPSAGATLVQQQFQIMGQCESGLDVMISGNGLTAPIQTTCVNNVFSAQAIVTAAMGTKDFRVQQVDMAGNTGFINGSVQLMINPPNINITSPTEGTVTNGTITLSGACDGEIDQVSLRGAGLLSPTITPCDSLERFSVVIQLTPGDGNKNIIVAQTNSYNVEGTDSRNFVLDTQAPILTIVSPASSAVVRDAVTVNGQCEVGPQVVIWGTGLNQTMTTDCLSGLFSQPVQLSSGDGSKLIRVSQTDSAGNVATAERTVIRDTSAPAIQITMPSENAVIRDQVFISGTCESGENVVISGSGVQATQTVSCSQSQFSATVLVTDGEGSKTIEVSQTDSASNTSSDTLTVVSDRTAPAVAITFPVEDTAGTGGLTLRGSCESGLSVRLSGSGHASPSTTACNNGQFDVSILFSSGDGSKVIIVSQTDAVGNTASDSRQFQAISDGTAPMVSVLQPDVNFETQGLITLTGACTENLAISISGDGVADTTATCVSGNYQAPISLSGPDGSKNVLVQQTNGFGQTGSAGRSYIKDTLVPSTAFSSPAAGTTTDSDLTITGSCENGLPVMISGTGVSVGTQATCFAGMFSALVELSDGDGSKLVMISQTDAAGNTGSSTRTFAKDSSVPVVSIVQPVAGSIHGSSVTVSGSCENGWPVIIAGSGVANQSTVTCSSRSFSTTVNLSSGDGNKQILARQTDDAGNAGQAAVTVTKDTVAPVVVISNTNQYLNTNSVLLQGFCESNITVQVSGSGLQNSASTNCAAGAYSVNVVFSSGDGSKYLEVRQTDSVGNTNSAGMTFYVDTVAPSVTITRPAAGARGEAGLTIEGNCENNINVVVSGTGVETAVIAPCLGGIFSADILFSPVDGTKLVQAAQTDPSGNTAQDTRTFEKRTLDGAVLYANNCASCHGDLSVTQRRNRTASQITTAIGSVPEMQTLNWLSGEQIQAIANVLVGDGGGPTQDCDDPQNAPVRKLTRLSVNQWLNSAHDILLPAIGSHDAHLYSRDIKNDWNSLAVSDWGKFDRLDSDVTVFHVRSYYEYARRLSEAVESRFADELLNYYVGLNPGSCSLNVNSLTRVCVEQFIRNFGLRMHRSPLSPEDVAGYYNSYIQASGWEGIGNIVFHFFMSPKYMFRVEMGTELLTNSSDVYKLTSYEIIDRLALQFWESIPDEVLFTMAASQDLTIDANFNAALNHIFSRKDKLTPGMRHFYRQWMGLSKTRHWHYWDEDLRALLMDSGVVRGSSPDHVFFRDLRDNMFNEVLELAQYHQDNGDSFQSLFTSNISFARDPALVSLYHVSGPAPTNITDSNAVRFPAGTRAGIVTRGAFLTDHGEKINIVKRSIRIREDFMCLKLPPPPADLPADSLLPPTNDGSMTTRELWEHKTSPNQCQACHSQINPFGHALGKFNVFGTFGNQEVVDYSDSHQPSVRLTVDDTVDFSPVFPDGITTNNPSEFGQMIANRPETRSCFSKRYFRYTYGEFEDSSKHSCQLHRVEQAIENNQSLESVLRAIVSEPMFRYRKVD